MDSESSNEATGVTGGEAPPPMATDAVHTLDCYVADKPLAAVVMEAGDDVVDDDNDREMDIDEIFGIGYTTDSDGDEEADNVSEASLLSHYY